LFWEGESGEALLWDDGDENVCATRAERAGWLFVLLSIFIVVVIVILVVAVLYVAVCVDEMITRV